MNKYFSLIKASMSEGMNIFKVSTKKQTTFTKIFLPIFIALIIMDSIYSYSEMIIIQLQPVKMEFVLLTVFILFTSILTLIEGIYKSGNLLFNCKDDNLLLSLPIKRRTVLFTRILKFYIFELLYNSLFILPAIICFAIHTSPSITYYITSFIGLFIFPIIPILVSCFIGSFTTFVSSRFKGKKAVETILTIIFLLGIFYISFNADKLINDIANNSSSINDFITKLYYPAGAYISLITSFSVYKLFEFIIINLGLFIISILIIGKFYFNINSSTKAVKTNKAKGQYKIKNSSPIKALIKKEFSRFLNSTVFITNAGFGLVLYIIACILLVIKFDTISSTIIEINPAMTADYIKSSISIILFGLVCFSSFMTSITSSMISLEGKTFNILKSLPTKPYTIVMSKVLAAVIIMIPCILIGDIIVFTKFKFDLLSILLILIASVLFPLLSETIGIIVNLKYPKMDAKNDTEVVKQSMSSAISVFIGMILLGITGYLLFKALDLKFSNNNIMLTFIGGYAIIYIGLIVYLNKTCTKSFNNITT